MSDSLNLGEALVRSLDRQEAEAPGNFYPVSALTNLMRDEHLELPNGLSMEAFLRQLVEWDWVEAGGDGNVSEFLDCSFRVTAKGQHRATASVDYAAQYRQMFDELPIAPDSPTETTTDTLAVEHQLTVPNFATGALEGQPTTLGTFQRIGLKQETLIDSKEWTGGQFVLIDPVVITQVKTRAVELREAVYAMRFESNSESQNLKGLVDALVAVCNMAEPEVTVIERILASPKFKTYAALFGIVAMIRGAIGF
jgi:hypothetical protein